MASFVQSEMLVKCKPVTGTVTGNDEKFLLDKPTVKSEAKIAGKNVDVYQIRSQLKNRTVGKVNRG